MNQTKVSKKILSLMLVLVMLTAAFAITAPVNTQAANPKISKKKLTVTVGKSKKLSISNAAKDSKVTWSTNKKAVATVNKNGSVKGIKAGTAVISAKYVAGKTTKTFTCTVTVKKAAVVTPEPTEAEEPKPTEPTETTEPTTETGEASMPAGAIMWESFEDASHLAVPYEAATLKVVEGNAKSGNKSLHVTDREKGHHGPSFNVEKIVTKGKTYTFSIWVKCDTDVSEVAITLKTTSGGSASYGRVATLNDVKKGEWVLLSGSKEIPSGAEGEIIPYVEMPKDVKASFYVDGFAVVPE